MNYVGNKLVESTRISFQTDNYEESSTIQGCLIGEKTYLILEKTPFHPIDANWPDQPADKGEIWIGEKQYHIENVVQYPIEKDTQQIIAANHNIRRNSPKHIFIVAHEISGLINPENSANMQAIAKVDKEYRKSISRPHSANHILDLALNKILNTYWKKTAKLDGFSNADFGKKTNEYSRITPGRSVDKYNLSKLEPEEFVKTEFEQNISTIERLTENTINDWITRNKENKIEITAEGDRINSLRKWTTIIDNTKIEMFCGGTHPQKIGDIGQIRIVMNYDKENQILTIETSVRKTQ